MYYLPNNIAIDVDGLIEGMLDDTVTRDYFFDIKTGDVVSVQDRIDTPTDTTRYYKIPRIHQTSKEKWMKKFIRELVYVENKKLAKELKERFEFTGVRGVCEYLEGYDESWIVAWNQWAVDFTFERLDEWFETLPVEIKEKWHGDDDCAICRAMWDSVDEEDLPQAFAEQNEVNAKKEHQSTQFNMDKTVKDIEEQLANIINKSGHEKELPIALIREKILNDKGSAQEANNRYFIWWTRFFEKEFEIGQSEPIIQAFTDAWNYFPHKALNNKSPHDLVREHRESAPDQEEEHLAPELPTVIVGGEKMSFDEYEKMLKRMEKEQRPFKEWISRVKKTYITSLVAESLPSELESIHTQVAKIFFDRVLQVGFVTFDHIRPEFIKKEFPVWWQTHAMFSTLKEKEVSSSIKKLFTYIEAEYGVAHIAFSKNKKSP